MADLIERIKEFNKGFSKNLLPVKYQRMSENQFSFFRGACHLFYEDLSKENRLPDSPLTWICGDLHFENFGSYKGDNRLVYFDLNDFNEALLAPASWEIVRMTTSILIAFDHIGEKDAQKRVEFFLQIYSSVLSKGKAKYIEPRLAKGIVRKFLKEVSQRREKTLIKERTTKKNGKLCFRTDNMHLLRLDKDLKKKLIEHAGAWITEHHKDYNCLDVVFRIAGTGSIGIKRYLFLLEHTKNKSYLLTDMKEANSSCLEKYVLIKQPSWNSEAERMVSVQNYMQNICPALLSTSNFDGSSYVIKELQPSEDKINIHKLENSRKELRLVISDMAILTASAQLRSSGWKGAAVVDDLIEFGINNQWQNSILNLSIEYCKRMKENYVEFKRILKSGLLP